MAFEKCLIAHTVPLSLEKTHVMVHRKDLVTRRSILEMSDFC